MRAAKKLGRDASVVSEFLRCNKEQRDRGRWEGEFEAVAAHAEEGEGLYIGGARG